MWPARIAGVLSLDLEAGMCLSRVYHFNRIAYSSPEQHRAITTGPRGAQVMHHLQRSPTRLASHVAPDSYTTITCISALPLHPPVARQLAYTTHDPRTLLAIFAKLASNNHRVSMHRKSQPTPGVWCYIYHLANLNFETTRSVIQMPNHTPICAASRMHLLEE